MLAVSDTLEMDLIRRQVQENMPFFGVDTTYRLHQAYTVSSGVYYVQIVDNIQRPYYGLLYSDTGALFLDARSVVSLATQRIDAALTAYNAGHWPYRGL